MSRFLSFVEIQTKITSLFAFAISIGLLVYHDISIDPWATSVFFVSMFLFDLTTTAINNYIDTKTNGQKLQFERKTARNIIFFMLGLATILGLYLVWLTDFVILLTGALCFFCGIVYTYGPVAISRIPLGEIFSGIFYGFFIPFILIYINVPEGMIISYGLKEGFVHLAFNINYLLAIGAIAIVPTLTTANIMLANNTCDLEKDIGVNRFTLVYYIGKERAVSLYAWTYYLAFGGIFLLAFLGIAPRLAIILGLLGLIPARKNIETFREKQVKSETFVTSIKNYILINGILVLSLILGILQKRFLISF